MIYSKRSSSIDLIENGDNFLLYSITNKYDRGPDLDDQNTKDEIQELVYQKGKFDLNRSVLEEIQNKKFDDNKFREMAGFSKEYLTINSINDDATFEANSVKMLYSLPNNSFTLVNDKENKIYLVKLVSSKKNTFSDFISCAKFLIEKKYTSKKKIIAFGGSAGGLLLGNIVNQIPDLLLGAIMAVPFVDNLTTNMDHSLPLTKGELLEFGDAKNNKEHFEYIRSYAPYDNLEKKDYPHILITTSLSDSRVLYDEPTKYCAKLRDLKTDNNLLLLKCEMDAGHGGKSGRTAAIEEIAFDYAFALKIADI